ncbi:MAG: hypothetical protein HDT39_08455 [Lachnospiraceae bacterium]|nr:hypothetical protein [Lachnospiraceae bacterium]
MKSTNELNADIQAKNYWRDNERFADFLNSVCFGGKEVIQPDRLKDADTEEAVSYIKDDQLKNIVRYRDVIKEYGSDMEFIFMGLENQTKVHYAMPVRTQLYDVLRYVKQCKIIEESHRKNKELKSSDEFLSGMKSTDRLKAVITIVLYYGEDDWDGAVKLSDMLDVPNEMKQFVNDYNIHLFQIKDLKGDMFKNKDNSQLFTLVNEFYGSKKGQININELNNKYAGMEIWWETLAAIGAITRTEKIIQQAIYNKGGRIKMCRALDNLMSEARTEGRIEGQVKAIDNIVLKLNLTADKACDVIGITFKEYCDYKKEVR